MTPAEQTLKFHWSRSSAQAKRVKAIGKDYMEKVKAAEKISLKILETVKIHGGPVTENDLEKLDSLSDKQLLAEIAYLRSTVAPNIKQKIKLPSGKFETFNSDEL